MLWIIEYAIYSIIIVFLADKIYNFIQNNNGNYNGVYERKIINDNKENKIKELNRKEDEKEKKVTFSTIDEKFGNANLTENEHELMEDELNKLFEESIDNSNISKDNTSNDIDLLISSCTLSNISQSELIETSNILDLPINN